MPNDPAMLAVTGHRFIAQEKKKMKNDDARVWGKKPEIFVGP